MSERLLLRPAEAADAIGVSRARAYELIAAGVIPHIKIGTSIRVPVDALRAWIARQLQPEALEVVAQTNPPITRKSGARKR
jgi:excisionase family DNA binding protein